MVRRRTGGYLAMDDGDPLLSGMMGKNDESLYSLPRPGGRPATDGPRRTKSMPLAVLYVQHIPSSSRRRTMGGKDSYQGRLPEDARRRPPQERQLQRTQSSDVKGSSRRDLMGSSSHHKSSNNNTRNEQERKRPAFPRQSSTPASGFLSNRQQKSSKNLNEKELKRPHLPRQLSLPASSLHQVRPTTTPQRFFDNIPSKSASRGSLSSSAHHPSREGGVQSCRLHRQRSSRRTKSLPVISSSCASTCSLDKGNHERPGRHQHLKPAQSSKIRGASTSNTGNWFEGLA